MEIKCSYTDLKEPEVLTSNPKNPNKHPERQIELLAKIINHTGFRHPIVISKRSGFIVAGHGRLQAALLLGAEEVPVDYQDFENEAEEFEFLVADNKIAELAEHDDKMLIDIVKELELEDLELLGIDDIEALEVGEDSIGGEDNLYTGKVESPIYEPQGENPALGELCDTSKTDELIKGIYKSNVPDTVQDFLRIAAYRHAVFDYEKIAEYYARADKETQTLIEDSALVIIDFKKAIEEGYVRMSANIAEAFSDSI